jgi:hypothetical protein
MFPGRKKNIKGKPPGFTRGYFVLTERHAFPKPCVKRISWFLMPDFVSMLGIKNGSSFSKNEGAFQPSRGRRETR